LAQGAPPVVPAPSGSCRLMRSIARTLLPTTLWNACLLSAVLHLGAFVLLWAWRPAPGEPLASRAPVRVQVVRRQRLASASKAAKPATKPPLPAVPLPPPAPRPSRAPVYPPPKPAPAPQVMPGLPVPVEDSHPKSVHRRPLLPEAKVPLRVALLGRPKPAEPEYTAAPVLRPVVQLPLPKPQPPAVEPPALPDGRRADPARKTTLVTAALDDYWRQQRNRDLERDRARAVHDSERSYTDAEAGHVVARFGATTVTRKQVEDMHERLSGVRLKDLALTPAQARRQIEGIVGGFLLPEIEVTEAEKRGYATRPGLRMETWLTGVVTGEEVRAYYEKNRATFQGRTLAESWQEIEDLLMGAELASRKQELEENLQQMRRGARVEKHYELLSQRNAPLDAALFTVNGRPYTLGQWRAELASMSRPPTSPAERERYADELIDRIILLSSTDGIQNVELRERLEAQRRSNLRRLLRHEEVEEKIELTEPERKQRYEERKSGLTVVGEIEVGWLEFRFPPGDTGAKAARDRLAKIRAEVEAGRDFDAVAQKHAKLGQGDFEAVGRGHWFSLLPAPFAPDGLPDRVRLLPKGATGDPFVYGDVGRLFHVYDRQASRPMTFDEAAPFVEGELWDAKHEARSAQFDSELVENADIRYNDSVIAEMVRRATGPGSLRDR